VLAADCGSCWGATAQTDRAHVHPVLVTIDARNSSNPVTQYEYGMFIEPIGGLITRTLWAEMLDDRKFYYAIVAEGKDLPPLSISAPARCPWPLTGIHRSQSPDTRWVSITPKSVPAARLIRSMSGIGICHSRVAPLQGSLTVPLISSSIYEFPVVGSD